MNSSAQLVDREVFFAQLLDNDIDALIRDLTKFGLLYVQKREDEPVVSTIVSIPLNIIQFAYAAYHREETPTEALIRIKGQCSNEINTCKNFDTWFECIFFLRHKAYEAHLQLTLAKKSLLCLTLHGLASMIVMAIRNHPKFPDAVSQLAAAQKKENEAVLTGQGDMEKLSELNFKLGSLEIPELTKYAFYNCDLFKEFPRSTEKEKSKSISTGTFRAESKTEIDKEIPVALQENYCLRLFNDEFIRTADNVNFDEFITSQILKESLKISLEKSLTKSQGSTAYTAQQLGISVAKPVTLETTAPQTSNTTTTTPITSENTISPTPVPTTPTATPPATSQTQPASTPLKNQGDLDKSTVTAHKTPRGGRP